jgi:aspartate/methionine/tyrosine aminotransferase
MKTANPTRISSDEVINFEEDFPTQEEGLVNEGIDFEEGLRKSSEMIQKYGKNLIPHEHNLTKDIERTYGLWLSETRRGVMLSQGGVERSIVDSNQEGLLTGFQGYKSDRPQSFNPSQDAMKNFCKEEGIISDAANISDLSASFCFGSHEGFTRLARCFHSNSSKEMIYSIGGYALLARAVSMMKPSSYLVHLADIDRENGEKIIPAEIDKIAQRNPKAKILYLEAKTTCGAVYSEEEIQQIVEVCKKHDMLLFYDTAHANMEFSASHKFPDVASICQRMGHEKFAIVFTGSKTYGLERGRMGFVIVGNGEFGRNLVEEMRKDGSRTHGSSADLSFAITKKLMETPIENRRQFLEENRQKHHLNMNVMIGYIEGVESDKIDEELREQVKAQIPPKYQDGISGVDLVYKPESGIQLKVNISGLRDKYFSNIRMFNSEIFSYALQKTTDVATLHSYQILDPEGSGMRLSFAIGDDIHKGMRRIHDFASILTPTPTLNKFMPEVELAESLIFPSEREIAQNITRYRSMSEEMDLEESKKLYENNVLNTSPKAAAQVIAAHGLAGEIVDLNATKIQKVWRGHSSRVNQEKELLSENSKTGKGR